MISSERMRFVNCSTKLKKRPRYYVVWKCENHTQKSLWRVFLHDGAYPVNDQNLAIIEKRKIDLRYTILLEIHWRIFLVGKRIHFIDFRFGYVNAFGKVVIVLVEGERRYAGES